MLIHVLKKSGLFIIILLSASHCLLLQGCKSKLADTADSSSLINLDTLPSADTMAYEVPVPNEPINESKKTSQRSDKFFGSSNNKNNSSNDNNLSGADNSPEIAVDNYIRVDNSPKSLARAAQHKIIQMIYLDAYQKAKTNILNEKENTQGQLELELEIEWKDRWVKKPYQIKVMLTVGKTGENAKAQILSKNAEAEVLEFTNKDAKEQSEIGNL
jgi:hypothetical protein